MWGCWGAAAVAAVGRKSQLLLLLLAEEKILVPDSDKDAKCLCPPGEALGSGPVDLL